MILLYNVYLDKNVRHPGLYCRGNYDTYNNIDIFKYTLASVVNIYSWSKVIINVVLHAEFENEKSNLFKYITDLFCEYNLILNNTRCERQEDWKNLYKILDNDLIYFCCNHDHVFIDDNVDNFKKTIEEFKIKFSTVGASLYFSHWQEVNNLFLNTQSYILEENFAHTLNSNFDSIQIITKNTYFNWWFTGDFNHLFLPRTDCCTHTLRDNLPTSFLKILAVPYREYFRHFDGYSHLSINQDIQKQLTNECPPLFIPPGFFKSDIKLKVGYDDNDQNSININLSKENYTVVDDNGTDMKCYLNEIPHFWKKKISGIDKNPFYDEQEHKNNRNNSIINPLTCGLFHFQFLNSSVLNNIKKTYKIN